MRQYCMYLRKSRADAEAEARGEGETLARHQAMLMEIAKKQKLSVVKVYKEIVSGDSIAARPEMQAMLADITECKYAGVLVVEIERLARGDTIDQGVVAQAFKQSDTKIITPTKTYDPQNEYDEEYFEFSLFMSRREYKTIKRRMQAGRLAAVKEGNYISTTPPYGYHKIQPEPKVHTLEIVPEEAEVIRLIYDIYLGGRGAKYIAEELNRMGIKPQKSEYWEAPSIKKILASPIYCGKLQWKTKSSGDTLYQGRHEPIISEEIFDKAQEKRKNNPAAQVQTNQELLNYYHGILYCKNCGHQMRRRLIRASGHEHMLCTHRECRGIVVSASFPEIDESLLTLLLYRVEKLKALSAHGNPMSKASISPDRTKPLVAELEKEKRRQAKLYDLLEQEVYDTATFLERSQVVAQRIKSLESAIAEEEARKEPQKLPPKEAIARLTYVINNFKTASPNEKNTMLHTVVEKIYYSKTQRMCCNKRNSDLTLDAVFL